MPRLGARPLLVKACWWLKPADSGCIPTQRLVSAGSLQGVVLAGLLPLCLPVLVAQVCQGASKHCRAHVGHQPGLARGILTDRE